MDLAAPGAGLAGRRGDWPAGRAAPAPVSRGRILRPVANVHPEPLAIFCRPWGFPRLQAQAVFFEGDRPEVLRVLKELREARPVLVEADRPALGPAELQI